VDNVSKLVTGGQLLAAERQRRIADLVREHGYVRGRMLASQFGVTNETIRRDLMQLEEAGIVDRSHGGAVARGRNETNFDRRLHENETAKIAIGRAAAALVTNGSTILLDSGSTTIHLARELHDKEDLVVVTTAVTHAAELMENPDITVIMTGGVVRRPTFSTSGELAITTLGELSVDQLFLAINSVSLEKGLMYPHFEEVGVKRAMIAAASEVILVADHTKFNERSLVRVAPLSVLSRIVTDTGIDPAIANALRDKDIEVILADPDDVPGESWPDARP
jgi:DeoR family transcriptional regulator, fructose operon transcriptional repressor